MELFITWLCNLSTFETETDLRINLTSSLFKPNSDLRIWHGEEHIASWRVFEDHMSGESTYGGTFIFDNNRTTKYISQTHTSNKRKIEITFHEPIYFEKLVIRKPSSPVGDSLDSIKFWSTLNHEISSSSFFKSKLTESMKD